jgi:deoxyribodipyrimidine photo-lyase
MVYQRVMQKGYRKYQIEKLIKELCWRDYFQRVAQEKIKEIVYDTGPQQTEAEYQGIPTALEQAATGISAIDAQIQELQNTGYMHNHMRMYVASLATNIGRYHWREPARWMYYYLLDADIASNHCSWQWVCGVRSKKKYIANQENINRYFHSQQKNTFLDHPYEVLEKQPVPAVLLDHQAFHVKTILPDTRQPELDPALSTLLYTPYNLDPFWHRDLSANRILLLEPAHFDQFPMHPRTLQFMQDLGQNIPGLQTWVASFEELQSRLGTGEILYKEHPLFRHHRGREDPRDWVVPEVSGYHPSFFAYWKKVEKLLP